MVNWCLLKCFIAYHTKHFSICTENLNCKFVFAKVTNCKFLFGKVTNFKSAN